MGNIDLEKWGTFELESEKSGEQRINTLFKIDYFKEFYHITHSHIWIEH